MQKYAHRLAIVTSLLLAGLVGMPIQMASANHCGASPTGCDWSGSDGPLCTKYTDNPRSGYAHCCVDNDGDGIYHNAMCNWTDKDMHELCQQFVKDPNDPEDPGHWEPEVHDFGTCTQGNGCQADQPLVQCTPGDE